MPLRLAGVCGLLAPVTFVTGFVLAGLAQADAYRPFHDDLSDLGALTADSPWLYNQLGANLAGLLVVAFAFGLWAALGRSRLGRLGAAALLVVGVGLFLDGLFRLDCRGIDAACDNESWHATAYGIESGFTGTAFLVGPLLLVFAFRRLPEWRDRWLPTLLAVPALVVTSIVVGLVGTGAGNLAASTVWSLWLAFVAAHLLRLQREVGPAVPAPPQRATGRRGRTATRPADARSAPA